MEDYVLLTMERHATLKPRLAALCWGPPRSGSQQGRGEELVHLFIFCSQFLDYGDLNQSSSA